MVANLHNLDILLHIPYSMLRLNLCIQAVHIKVDTLSEQAKSFSLEIPLHSKDFNTSTQGGLLTFLQFANDCQCMTMHVTVLVFPGDTQY